MKYSKILRKIIFFGLITLVCSFIFIYIKSTRRISINNQSVTNEIKVTSVPTPTPIKYLLPSPDFSGIRQTLTPKGEIREIVGKVITYNKETNKLKMGDEAIPFIYEVNISTSEAFMVDEVSVNEKGIVVYSKSDESKIIFGIKIIADCPEEKIDPGCQVISKVHILKGEISKKILVPKFVLPTK